MNARYIIKTAILLLACTLAGRQYAVAQLNPIGSMYFQNQYLGNPALAGSVGLNLNLGYLKQWNNLPGSPEIQSLTADYALNDKVGLGLNIYNDKAGLFKRTRTVASYAYHLPLNEVDQKLSFGLSIGFMKERISNEDIDGEPGDFNVNNYTERETYIDGDFGIAFISNKLNVQASVPNMKSFFKKDLITSPVDNSTFFSSISYKVKLSDGTEAFELEPKICYRGMQGFDNILDAGANLSYAGSRVSVFGMYHSSESATFGLGLTYQSLGISGMYTTSTSALGGYTNGNFEINLKVNLFK